MLKVRRFFQCDGIKEGYLTGLGIGMYTNTNFVVDWGTDGREQSDNRPTGSYGATVLLRMPRWRGMRDAE